MANATGAHKPSCVGQVAIGLGAALLGLVLVIAGIAGFSALPSGVAGVLIGGALLLGGIGIGGWGLFVKLAGDVPASPTQLPAVPAGVKPAAGPPDWPALAQAHEAELCGLPTPSQRVELLRLWHEAMDRRAHDYLDLLVRHASVREQVFEAQTEAMFEAFLSGYMAGRGWADAQAARAASGALGHALRERLRQLGLPLGDLRPAFGAVMDDALLKIAEFGRSAGSAP